MREFKRFCLTAAVVFVVVAVMRSQGWGPDSYEEWLSFKMRWVWPVIGAAFVGLMLVAWRRRRRGRE